MHEFDKGSKWMIQHHGDSILRLARVPEIVTWRPLQAEVVQPRQLPDGLLEVQFKGLAEADLFILELATYPEPRLSEQVARDLMLVYLDRRVLPEVIAVILHPRGPYRNPATLELKSKHGLSLCAIRWRIIELWTLPAEQLLAAKDVGLIPWVPLTNFAEPPEAVLQRCRECIDQDAPPEERLNLLAVTQVMARIRYNDPWLLSILGGSQIMFESPLIQEVRHRDILMFLRRRFTAVPKDVETALHSIYEPRKVDELVELAATCPDLNAFRARLKELEAETGNGDPVQ